MLIYFFSAIAIMVFVAFLSLLYKHIRVQRRIQNYQKQGIYFAPGYRRFFFGNILDFAVME